MAIRENYNQDQTVITYEQTGRSTNTNELGMRDMQARFYVSINGVSPEEWFVVPLPIIREAIVKFMDGSIVNYTYNREQQALDMPL